MTVSLTVLGCAGTYPGAARACSSYLVQCQGYRLLLDCGNGSLCNLQQRVGLSDIDAVIVSHLHHDHVADIIGLYYGLRLHPDGPRSVPVHGPAGTFDHLARLIDDRENFARHCRFSVAAAGDLLELGPFRVTLFEAAHPVETLASRIEVDGRVLAYSGDSGPTPQLSLAARDADLFLADATWLERNKPPLPNLHMTGAEAGAQAADAGTARLLLTHLFPATDPTEVAAEAADRYDGEILVARDLLEVTL